MEKFISGGATPVVTERVHGFVTTTMANGRKKGSTNKDLNLDPGRLGMPMVHLSTLLNLSKVLNRVSGLLCTLTENVVRRDFTRKGAGMDFGLNGLRMDAQGYQGFTRSVASMASGFISSVQAFASFRKTIKMVAVLVPHADGLKMG